MTGTAVFIATTQTPVRILRLVVEPRVSLSTACLNLRASKASISDAYNDFVSLDTGIIARHTQQENYRLDLSDDIAQGNSWQLGAFIGHQLSHAGKLAHCDPSAATELADVDRIIWASGEVDVSGRVHAVSDIERKLAQSRALFADAHRQCLPVCLMLPEGNREPSLQVTLGALQAEYPSLSVQFISQVRFDDPSALPPTADPYLTLPAPRSPAQGFMGKYRSAIAAVSVGTLLLVGALAGVKGFVANSGASSAVEVSMRWEYAKDGRCFSERTRSEPRAVRWERLNKLSFEGALCRIEFDLDKAAPPGTSLEILADQRPLDLSLDRSRVAPRYLLNLYLLQLPKNSLFTINLMQNDKKMESAQLQVE